MPPSNPDPPPDETRPHGFALTQADIDEFKEIVRSECGVELTDHEAWGRVIELLNLYRALLGPIPEDPESQEHSGHLVLQRKGVDASLPRMDREYTISESESDREEWKAAPVGDLLERGMQTVCAFLNSYGGRVIFGVDANGKSAPIPGNIDQVQLAITNHIQNHLKPNARAFIDVAAHEGRIYVFVRPEKGQIYSHRNIVYRRMGSSTIALTYQQAKELENQRKDGVQEHAPDFSTRMARGESYRCTKCGHELHIGFNLGAFFGAPPAGPEPCPQCGGKMAKV